MPLFNAGKDEMDPTADGPKAGEIWRAGDDGVPVWVRQVFDDGVVDVIPLSDHPALADEPGARVGTQRAVVALRIHLAVGSLTERTGRADIGDEIEWAMRQGESTPSLKAFSARQEMHARLVTMSPSLWRGGADRRTGGEATYTARAWPQGKMWLARVLSASEGADTAPLGALTQSPTREGVVPMVRDLVATILDERGTSFEITIEWPG